VTAAVLDPREGFSGNDSFVKGLIAPVKKKRAQTFRIFDRAVQTVAFLKFGDCLRFSCPANDSLSLEGHLSATGNQIHAFKKRP
jgi:hypothetical protein